MEKTNEKRSLETKDASPVCVKKRRESEGLDQNNYPVVIKQEKDEDDPLYQPVLDDADIKNVVKEEFIEEETVLESLVDCEEDETSPLANLLVKREYEGGSQIFTAENASRTKLGATENAASSSKNELSPKLVVYPLTTDGSLQVESVTSRGNKIATNKANTAVRILNSRKPRTRAVQRAPQRRQVAASASEEEYEEEEYEEEEEEEEDEEEEDEEEEFEHLLEKKVRKKRRRKKRGNEESWTSSSISMKTFKFTRAKSWLMPRTTEPADYFKYFYDDNYLKELADATNQEAYSKKNNRHDIVHLRGWTDVTVSEMKIFLGLLLHTGTAKMAHLGDYWRQHRLFKSCFRDYMTPQRFTIIMRYLTIPNCAGDRDGIWERFNSVMDKIYYPGRNLNLDTTIVDWSLKPMYSQYQSWMDKVTHTRITTLREQDGMIIHIVVGTTLRKPPDAYSTFKMLNGKLDGGHSLNVSNAIAMTPLVAGKLLDKNTYCTAVNVEKIPTELLEHEVEPGQNRSLFRLGVHVGKYNSGSANIYYLTTEFKDEMKQSKSSQFTEPVAVSSHEERQKPIESIDLFEYYPCEVHKLVRIKRIFIHCLMLSLMNANLLYNAFSGTTLNFSTYRLKVIEHLLPEIDVEDNAVKPTQVKKFNTQPVKPVQPPREILPTNSCRGKPHKMSKIPKSKTRISENGKVVKATSRRLCKNCTKVKNVKKNCIYECTGCKGSPALCLDCFFEIHNVTV